MYCSECDCQLCVVFVVVVVLLLSCEQKTICLLLSTVVDVGRKQYLESVLFVCVCLLVFVCVLMFLSVGGGFSSVVN